MSRIGKNPVAIPASVEVTIKGSDLSVKGPKGMLGLTVVDEVEISRDGDAIAVRPRSGAKNSRSMWGMQRTLVNNLILGVTDGFEKKLEIIGVGYRAQMQGNDLILSLGFSHEVRYPAPEGISISLEGQNQVIISGCSKQQVGQVAAEIRALRPPEPYKGKGIRYIGEYVRRKEGKKK